MNGLQIDINTGDLLVAPAGAVVAVSDSFIAEFVVRSLRGDIKEHPLLGAEAPLLLTGTPDPFWPGNTKKCYAPAALMCPTSPCPPMACAS